MKTQTRYRYHTVTTEDESIRVSVGMSQKKKELCTGIQQRLMRYCVICICLVVEGVMPLNMWTRPTNRTMVSAAPGVPSLNRVAMDDLQPN